MYLKELMQRYCDGDSRAFRALYDQTAPALYAYLVRRTGDRGSAEELLQDAFLKLHNARATFVRGADPRPLMYAIATRTFVDYTRRRKHARVRASSDGSVPDVPCSIDGRRVDDEPEPSIPCVVSEVLQAAIDRLPAPQRAAFELTKLRHRSVADAAAELGITANATKLRAHRALQRLRRDLAAPLAAGVMGRLTEEQFT
jgi:RNA polymerase sigma-70 factor (ECF subfamily)